MFLLDRLAAAAVDGEDRQEQERDRRQREVRGEHDDRRQAEHQAVDRGLEEQVAHHVAEDLRARRERDDGGHQRDVHEEERGRGEQDAGQVDRSQVRLRGARETGRVVEHERGGADGDRVLEEVERDLLERLAADRVGQNVGRSERDEAGQRAGDEHRRERERGRGGDLSLRSAREDLQRDELTGEGERKEHQRLRRDEATKIVRAIQREPDCAQRPDRDNGGDVGVEWAESNGAGDHRASAAVAGGADSRRPGTTTCGRYGPSSGLAPLGAGAEALEEHSHNARDKRETVETCLHHGLRPPCHGSPLESLSSLGCR